MASRFLHSHRNGCFGSETGLSCQNLVERPSMQASLATTGHAASSHVRSGNSSWNLCVRECSSIHTCTRKWYGGMSAPYPPRKVRRRPSLIAPPAIPRAHVRNTSFVLVCRGDSRPQKMTRLHSFYWTDLEPRPHTRCRTHAATIPQPAWALTSFLDLMLTCTSKAQPTHPKHPKHRIPQDATSYM